MQAGRRNRLYVSKEERDLCPKEENERQDDTNAIEDYAEAVGMPIIYEHGFSAGFLALGRWQLEEGHRYVVTMPIGWYVLHLLFLTKDIIELLKLIYEGVKNCMKRKDDATQNIIIEEVVDEEVPGREGTCIGCGRKSEVPNGVSVTQCEFCGAAAFPDSENKPNIDIEDKTTRSVVTQTIGSYRYKWAKPYVKDLVGREANLH